MIKAKKMIKQASAGDRCILVPTNETGGRVEIALSQVTISGKQDVRIIPGPSSEDGCKTFHALFTRHEALLAIKWANKSGERVK